LSKTVARDYSPLVVAGQIWNHAPAIWSHLKEQGISCPRLTEEQGAALFAYFASARYFEAPGNAQRGKAVYGSRRCADCHAVSAAKVGIGNPIPSWHSLQDPIALACALLNRPLKMNGAVAGGKRTPAPMTSEEVNDLLVYVRNQPTTRGSEIQYSLPIQSKKGHDLFDAKGCARCHTGNLALDRRDSRVPFYSGFVAAMWNHDQRLTGTEAKPTCDELQAIAGYLWSAGLFDEHGNAARGKRLYTKLGCASCHASGQGAPVLMNAAQQKDQVPFCVYIAVGVWNHGSVMLERLQTNKVAWPKFTHRQLADLSAYLQASPATAGHK
jgi:cytochrome c551/c552